MTAWWMYVLVSSNSWEKISGSLVATTVTPSTIADCLVSPRFQVFYDLRMRRNNQLFLSWVNRSAYYGVIFLKFHMIRGKKGGCLEIKYDDSTFFYSKNYHEKIMMNDMMCVAIDTTFKSWLWCKWRKWGWSEKKKKCGYFHSKCVETIETSPLTH